MRERPILFSDAMVRAILGGAKTETRRILTPRPSRASITRFERTSPETCATSHWPWHAPNPSVLGGCEWHIDCPYGEPGDRLWVRETWGQADRRHSMAGILYRADGDDQPVEDDRWRPSIHMRRAASRIDLEVISVRVERLQAITADDILAEGIRTPEPSILGGYAVHNPEKLRALWIEGWDRINGERGPWKDNPFVWVIGFKVLHPAPEAARRAAPAQLAAAGGAP